MILPQISEILAAYFLNPETVTCKEFKSGLTNYNYQLKDITGKLFFLKIFRNANLPRVASVANLLRNLHLYRFPTPEIIPCLSGNYYWNNGDKGAIITRFITGRYPENTEENLYHIANILAALHQIPLRQGLIQGYSFKL